MAQGGLKTGEQAEGVQRPGSAERRTGGKKLAK